VNAFITQMTSQDNFPDRRGGDELMKYLKIGFDWLSSYLVEKVAKSYKKEY